MTLAHLPENGDSEIWVRGDVVYIRQLTVPHPEAAALVRSQLEKSGAEITADVVRRALTIGLVSLNMSSTAMDSGAVARTLDHYITAMGTSAQATIADLTSAAGLLRQGEQAVVDTANRVLENLPGKLDAALAGQSESVRHAVATVTQEAVDVGVRKFTAAAAEHSATVTRELSLNGDGGLRNLQQDLSTQNENLRRELTTLLASVMGRLDAAEAAKTAGAKSSRAIGAEVEQDLMARCDRIVTAAGDRFEATGNQSAPDGRRTGDGVATLDPLIGGAARELRIVLEAKKRSTPLSVQALKVEATNACTTRRADGALIVVPTREEVPGETSIFRLDATHWVVSADSEAFECSYVWLREAVALHARRVGNEDGIDLAKVDARINAGIQAIEELDEVERTAYLARRNIDKVITASKATQEKVRETLTEGLAALRA